MSNEDKPLRPTLEEIDPAECMRLVASTPVGRLGFIAHGKPMILPVNHVVEDDTVLFRTQKGDKLDVAERSAGTDVVYEVDQYDPDDFTGWSVVVQGKMEPILDLVEAQRLDGKQHVTWADDVERRRWVRITAGQVTGRRIVKPS